MDIIYRCCEVEMSPPFKPIRPSWFDKRKCLKSFLDAYRYDKRNIQSLTFLHDGPEGELFDLIKTSGHNLISKDFRSNESSLLETFDIADSLQGDSIYFVEDDYLHLPESIEKIRIATKVLGLVNGYDHLDRYIRTDDITEGKDSIVFIPQTNLHWRTAESTCCTWSARRNVWNHIKDECRHFKLQDRELFRFLYRNGFRLWTPMPGLTTQVDDKLSPGINWQSF